MSTAPAAEHDTGPTPDDVRSAPFWPVLLGQLLPLVLVLGGWLDYVALLVGYAVEAMVIGAVNWWQVTQRPREQQGILMLVARQGSLGIAGLMFAFLSTADDPADVLVGVGAAVLLVGGLVVAGLRGESMTSRVGEPEGTWFRLPVLMGGLVGVFLLDSLDRMAEHDRLGADSFTGIGGAVGEAIARLCLTLDRPPEVVLAVVLLVWKTASEAGFELWRRAPAPSRSRGLSPR